MSKIELIATATFGLEAVVKREIQELGYKVLRVEDAKVTFAGDETAIAKANICLRSADRVLVKMGEYEVESFEELFEKTKALPWEEWIPVNGRFIVSGTSVKSKLYSVPDCQSIVEKAVVERLKQTYHQDWFQKSGADFGIKVGILKDVATLTIDSSGPGLHKRGYRIKQVEAPMKETLAAALVQLSFWEKDRLLVDPFCGSGTIAIEAAMMGCSIAPGLSRKFASEGWERIPQTIWKQVRKESFGKIRQDVELQIFASDISKDAVEAAKENAMEAGVEDQIQFKVLPFKEFTSKAPHGMIITNPPYGERIGDKEAIDDIYEDLSRFYETHPEWSLFMITADKEFEGKFFREKADKKRKLYNGRLETTYFQYFGKR